MFTIMAIAAFRLVLISYLMGSPSDLTHARAHVRKGPYLQRGVGFVGLLDRMTRILLVHLHRYIYKISWAESKRTKLM